jgi:hypothetical protein
MAEGWARKLGSDVLEAYSAGTEDYPEFKDKAEGFDGGQSGRLRLKYIEYYAAV